MVAVQNDRDQSTSKKRYLSLTERTIDVALHVFVSIPNPPRSRFSSGLRGAATRACAPLPQNQLQLHKRVHQDVKYACVLVDPHAWTKGQNVQFR